MFGIEKAKFRNKTMKKIILLVPFEKWKWKSLSRVVSDSLWPPWNSPGQITGVGSLSLLQGIFATQGSNPGLPHCGWILYQLSHEGSPRILEWVAYPFSRGSSQPRNLLGSSVSCIAGGFFTNWAIREAPKQPICHQKMNALKRVSVCICREIYRYRHVKFRVSLKGNSDTCQKWMKF